MTDVELADTPSLTVPYCASIQVHELSFLSGPRRASGDRSAKSETR